MNARMPVKGRFAPSPSGRMHAGNICAALVSWLITKSCGGTMVLRIEDLDAQRSKPEYRDALLRDLAFLGLTWDEGPFYQSDNTERYLEALERLASAELLYPCFCTRADLHASSAPHEGERRIYPGTCKALTPEARRAKAQKRKPALRVRVSDATDCFTDILQGTVRRNLGHECGDFIVQRSDGAMAYQLAVVVDDAHEGIDTVVRGYDLIDSSPQQRYLQECLSYPHPRYAHIPLIVDERGRRLSKRNHDAALEALLATYKTAEGIIGRLAGLMGLTPSQEPISCEELLTCHSIEPLKGTASLTWGG